MNEPIRLPENERTLQIDGDFDGCVIIRTADGSPMIPVLNAKDFQPIVLTCIPTDVILVEIQSLGIAEDLNLGDPEFVLGFGYPDL
jgi:hypothetical protein